MSRKMLSTMWISALAMEFAVQMPLGVINANSIVGIPVFNLPESNDERN